MISFSSTIDSTNADIECISVLLPLPLGRAYTYAVSVDLLAEHPLEIGDFVLVPLGTREVTGVIWDGQADNLPSAKLKYVLAKLETPRMSETTRRFAEWVANYNMASLGSVLKMFISVPDALKPPKPITVYSLTMERPEIKMTEARVKVMKVLGFGDSLSADVLSKKAGVGASVIKNLVKLEALKVTNLPPPPTFKEPAWRASGPTLSVEQATVANKIREFVKKGQFSALVLEGVPGSGKTEVYLEAVCQALAQGKQALVLLPEIALGAQWLARFKERFGCAPAEWHSDLTQAKRRITWRAVATGEAKV
ncbi:DEAD/DEAH box helicase family protein, partial [Gammaproteobacteria bacterium]|nr:DEAD/DEAH box helicase family protein [Gammaproteobacteria bacterium]